MPPRMVLIRHGQTEWSKSGRHTSRTDVSLMDEGCRQAERAGELLLAHGFITFAQVLTSPLRRASETCAAAGFRGEIDPDLVEWDYGEYEGLTTMEIRRDHPGWTIWTGEVPGGETIADVAARADRALVEIRAADGDVVVFSHGHFLRVLAARWLGLEPSAGALLALDPATISVLGHEHDRDVIREWNAVCDPVGV